MTAALRPAPAPAALLHSQVEVASRLGVDRTPMAVLVDGLEDHGLVERRRSAQDRRKNTVQLTAEGRDCLHRAEGARHEMERRFLAPLGEEGANSLLRSLRVLVTDPPVTA
ncbi:MarR family winged helix-turn-helix transcriptional regulator [Streptomyces sp. NPDC060065]|uniref:MarR family winged helix-turn-helix transcriptional regulator n=1 Tax=Streptomyces sp. NPDC060065 TaxID=3347050 RepID=UPI0036CA87EC